MLSQTQCKAFYFATCPFVMAFWHLNIDLPINLPKWNHYKVALFHQRMRQCKLFGTDVQIVIHQYVNVYRSVVIMTVYRLNHPSKPTFDALCCGKQLLWRQCGEHPYTHIKKLIGRLKSPWFRFKH